MFWDKKKNEEEKKQGNEQTNIQAGIAEEEAVAGQTNKKKYCYMVVDKDNVVMLGKKGNPFFVNVEEGASPEWSNILPQDMVSRARIDKELRVELRELPENLSKNDRKKAWSQIKEDAREELLKIGAERIAAAQENTKEKPIEQADSVKPEATSAPEEIVAEAPIDLSVITTCVERNAKQLSEDLTINIDDLIEVINNNGNENTEVIKSYVEAQSRHICDTTLRTACDTVRDIAQKTQKYAENIVSRVNENGRSIGESQDKLLSRVNTVGKRITEFVESVEGIEGNLHRLEQLDEITELLRDKGLIMSRDIPPVNADEEDIINLVRYSQKITEQLGYAARDLIRKQEAFKSQEESNANEQRVMEQKIAKAHDEGVEEGKKVFIKQLLSKYEDVDTIRESDNNHVHAIWTLLMELGVSIDGEGYYEKGKEIELVASDIEKMIGTYSKLGDAGKYRVIRTGLCFQGEILCKAAFEKVTETAEPEVTNAEVNPETSKEEDEQDAASEVTK